MWARRKPGPVTVKCRDIAGRTKRLVITPTEDGTIALILPPGEMAELDPLAVGRLRAALRDAILATEHPATQHEHAHVLAVRTVLVSA